MVGNKMQLQINNRETQENEHLKEGSEIKIHKIILQKVNKGM